MSSYLFVILVSFPISSHLTCCILAFNCGHCREGYIVIVHDAMSTYIDTIPWLVEEENTLNCKLDSIFHWMIIISIVYPLVASW